MTKLVELKLNIWPDTVNNLYVPLLIVPCPPAPALSVRFTVTEPDKGRLRLPVMVIKSLAPPVDGTPVPGVPKSTSSTVPALKVTEPVLRLPIAPPLPVGLIPGAICPAAAPGGASTLMEEVIVPVPDSVGVAAPAPPPIPTVPALEMAPLTRSTPLLMVVLPL